MYYYYNLLKRRGTMGQAARSIQNTFALNIKRYCDSLHMTYSVALLIISSRTFIPQSIITHELYRAEENKD